MAAKRRRTTKIHWNIGMIIFVVILVYILINVILFLGKKKLTVYKVTEDKITNTLSFTGMFRGHHRTEVHLSEYQQPVEAEQGLNLEVLILLRILTLHWQSALQQD